MFGDHYVPALTNFTGQHRCVFESELGQHPPAPGSLVVATGRYAALVPHPDGDVTVNESVPIVRLSTRKRDVTVFGVVSSVEDPGALTRDVSIGHMRFELPASGPPRVVVNGCGEGGILVCSEAGRVRNGDLLCASSRPGIAMRQRSSVVRSWTCAKATGDAATGGESVMIGCVYKF